jgi:hypothetical protein
MKRAFSTANVVAMSLACFCISSVHADEYGENVLYVGSGSAKSGDTSTVTNKNPVTLGYLRQSRTSDVVWGFDLSKEGSMLDSTGGRTQAVKQATSYNFLVGKNVAKNENSRFDAALLLGLREKTAECPKSYLGYQCYANSTPETKYGFNYGVVATWTYKSLVLGGRVTGESAQALVGIKF